MALIRNTSWPDAPSLLQGERVYLRSPRMSDFSEWSELREESRDYLVPWEPTWSADDLSRNAFRRRLRRYARDMRSGTAHAFFIFENDGNDLVGGCTLSNLQRGVSQSCSVGYWVGERFAGQGHMTDALNAVVSYVFDGLGLHRLDAACLPTNDASTRVLRKCGFCEEGYARQYLKINGSWQDHLLFAVVDGDPRPQNI